MMSLGVMARGGVGVEGNFLENLAKMRKVQERTCAPNQGGLQGEEPQLGVGGSFC